ncbi:hypothetical protein [Angelakisella massiliensis]|uniref:hypothetical protein n=1 Tax=Angelakisella massiliensis TaxID=1871018 RepID=UPI0023A8A501|nr:hypothetical protein [Angelakisella massiliensis]
MKVLIFCSAVIPAAGIAVELLTRKSYGKLPSGTLYVPAVCRVCWHIISLALAMMGILPTDLSMKSRQTLWVLMALCVALIEIPTWMSRRYRAAVGKDTLYVTPYWGKKRALPLSQISRVWRSTRHEALNICKEGKLFCRIPGICVGYKEFRRMLEERGLLPCWK